MVEVLEKQCRLCEFIKPIDDFYFRKSRGTYYYECKSCSSTKSLNNYKLNKNKRSQQMRQYYQDNQKSLVDKNRQYYTDNRLMVLKRNKEWRDEFRAACGTSYNNFRYRNNTNHKISCNLRSRLYDAVNNRVKSGSAIFDLGCSISELKKHIESKFLPGMTWDNHTVGGWHIDHIKPLYSFDLTDKEEFLKACHYTNLQPLWAKDNWHKNRQQ